MQNDSMVNFGLVLLLGAAPQPSASTSITRYVASVSYWEGKCRYWTGDVMFDADGFRGDLKSRFDTSMGITIIHQSDVPATCVREAKKLAAEVGFDDVRSEVGEVDLSVPK